MPTTSAVGTYSLTNIGPLTTTFTAPSSCETTDFLYGWKAFAVDNPERGGYMAVVGAGGCGTGGDQYEEHGNCYPHGDKLDELAGETYALPYYSPANACPSGYQTVGIAAMSSGSASLSGIFTPKPEEYWESPAPTTTASDRAPEFNWLANRLTSALGPQETIVACCPSGYELDGYGPQCYSTFPVSELASSTGCAPMFIEDHPYPETVSPVYTTETWEYDGTTFTNTNWIPVEPTGTDFATTTTYTFDDQGLPTAVLERFEDDIFMQDLYGLNNNDTKFIGGAHVAVMYLFYDGAADESSSESNSAVEASGAEESGSAVTSGGAEGTDEPSAASALAPANLWRAVGGVMAVWTVGAIAGVGLMAAL